jgi:RNA polymerase sigma factor (sigma-70 family)
VCADQIEPARASASQAEDDAAAQIFAQHREVLVGIAYRMLGRLADAEDVVQEAWLRWRRADLSHVQDARAFLIRVTTRLAIDRFRRIRAQREEYIGSWLPDPALSSQVLAEHLPTSPDPLEEVELAESVSMALLVVLETLSPLERAVFVLREVFGLSHPEVADIIGRSEAAVRQLAARARSHVQAGRPRFSSDADTRRRVTERFLTACSTGNLEMLLTVLAPDVTLVADSGGKARAPRLPLYGADAVVRFLRAVARPENTARFLASLGLTWQGDTRKPPAGYTLRVMEVNGAPSFVAIVGQRIVTVLAVDVVGERVQTIHLIANPDKLAPLSRAVAMSHLEGDAASHVQDTVP